MILVLNSGSSSVKYRTVDHAEGRGERGLVERIGEAGGPPDHHAAIEEVFDRMPQDRSRLRAVGHRVVHGGARFTGPTIIDDEVVRAIRALIPLAPLHNPGSLAGIEAARRALPSVAQVAVFDTAFHADLPARRRPTPSTGTWPPRTASGATASTASRTAMSLAGPHGC